MALARIDEDEDVCDNCGGPHLYEVCPECKACGGGPVNGHEPFCDLLSLRREKDTINKIRYLLDTFHLWSQDGVFQFPDGDLWKKGQD